MPNRNYEKGRRKEYKIVHKERDKDRLAFRSAGSHSPIDVVSIDVNSKQIYLIQSKPNSMSENAKNKIIKKNELLNGTFNVSFVVV